MSKKKDTDFIQTDMFDICDKNLRYAQEKHEAKIYKRWIVGTFIGMVILIVLFVFKSRGML